MIYMLLHTTMKEIDDYCDISFEQSMNGVWTSEDPKSNKTQDDSKKKVFPTQNLMSLPQMRDTFKKLTRSFAAL